MDLQRFPFDKQRMSLILSSAIPAQVGEKKIIDIAKDRTRPSVIARSNFSASNVFQLAPDVRFSMLRTIVHLPFIEWLISLQNIQLRFRQDKTDIRESTSGTIRPRLEISFSISRYSECKV